MNNTVHSIENQKVQIPIRMNFERHCQKGFFRIALKLAVKKFQCILQYINTLALILIAITGSSNVFLFPPA